MAQGGNGGDFLCLAHGRHEPLLCVSLLFWCCGRGRCHPKAMDERFHSFCVAPGCRAWTFEKNPQEAESNQKGLYYQVSCRVEDSGQHPSPELWEPRPGEAWWHVPWWGLEPRRRGWQPEGQGFWMTTTG